MEHVGKVGDDDYDDYDDDDDDDDQDVTKVRRLKEINEDKKPSLYRVLPGFTDLTHLHPMGKRVAALPHLPFFIKWQSLSIVVRLSVACFGDVTERHVIVSSTNQRGPFKTRQPTARHQSCPIKDGAAFGGDLSALFADRRSRRLERFPSDPTELN